MNSARILGLTLVVTLMSGIAMPAGAVEPVALNWIALKAGRQVMTAEDVRRYIDAVVLSSDAHVQLFREAGRDHAAYLKQKEAVQAELFELTLDRLALMQVAQDRMLRGSERRYLTLSKQEMTRALESRVSVLLSPFQAAGKSREQARIEFGEQLIAEGFPHAADETPDQVFEAWRQRLRVRMREEYRQREISKYLCELDNCSARTPSEIFRLNRRRFEGGTHLVVRPAAKMEIQGSEAFDRILSIKDQGNELAAAPVQRHQPEVDYYVGRIIGTRVEILHFNDWNLLGPVGTALGYPKTDDQGRTSGVAHSRTRIGTQGETSAQLENWLFTEKAGVTPGGVLQNIEEETTLRIASRQFLDEQGNTWLVVGIAGTHRKQREGFGAWLQESFHQLNSSNTHRINVHRDGEQEFLQSLVGMGAKYSIIESAHVDLILSGQGVLAPTVGELSQNSVNVRSALDVNIYGRTRQLPLLRIGMYSEARLRADGSIETVLGARATITGIIRKLQVEAGLFVVRWDGELDQRYEGGASWTTGLMVSVTPPESVPAVDYEL